MCYTLEVLLCTLLINPLQLACNLNVYTVQKSFTGGICYTNLQFEVTNICL